MTAAGEWLNWRYRGCDDTCTTDCGACKGAGPPVVEDQADAGLTVGAIGRSLADAAGAAAYRAQLDELWRGIVDASPDDQ